MVNFSKKIWNKLNGYKEEINFMKDKTLLNINKKSVVEHTISDVCNTVKKLNSNGFLSVVHYLSDKPETKDKARENSQSILRLLDDIYKKNLESTILLDLTSIGLEIDEEFCYLLAEKLLKSGKKTDTFIRINMEEYEKNEAIIRIYEKLAKKYKKCIGLTIHAHLYKSENDVNYLRRLHADLRIQKDVNKESERVAFSKGKDVSDNFVKLVETQLESRNFLSIATHDKSIIEYIENFVEEEQIDEKKYEFELLYGMKEEKQKELKRRGHTVRILVPFRECTEMYNENKISKSTKGITKKIGKLLKNKRGKIIE